jgi:hypothetical protein
LITCVSRNCFSHSVQFLRCQLPEVSIPSCQGSAPPIPHNC